MNRNQTKEYLKTKIEDYLSLMGINTKKKFRCLNPNHEDKNPSMSLDKRNYQAHCFSCGAKYDIFSLIGINENLSSFPEQFKKACELYNIEVDGYKPKKVIPSIRRNYPIQDYRKYFQDCQMKISNTDYPQSRGLSYMTINHFKLGFDENFTQSTGNQVWKALIIPTGNNSFVARNTNPQVDKHNRYRKVGESQIFNIEDLKTSNQPIFICEGEIDALSIWELGKSVIALGSTSNKDKFLSLLEKEKPSQPLILALDNDVEGKNTSQTLSDALKTLSIDFIIYNPYDDFKDANEALIANREYFQNNLISAEMECNKIRLEKLKQYQKEYVSEYIQDFLNGISNSVNTPVVSTGFRKLDNSLNGGLYEGLYIIGAISSLGKTTFTMQIADQIAQFGTDVIIFSLEMARNEIIAKSISRNTFTLALKNHMDTKFAKTSRGITTGAKYSNYSNQETDLINKAISIYQQSAKNMIIKEGIGDIGVQQVREYAQNHISITEKRPIVIIDYLQILSPYSQKMTDKQNTDKSVLELKRISRDFKIPVIAISSFNRANYNTPVSMEAFKESGAIEYSSDVLIGLQLKGAGQKDFDINAEKNRNPRNIELVILKNRNGSTGEKISYRYYSMFNHFEEVQEEKSFINNKKVDEVII